MTGNIGRADHQQSSFSEAISLLAAAEESDGKNCSGCRFIGYDCAGHPECIRGHENICFKTNYLLREQE